MITTVTGMIVAGGCPGFSEPFVGPAVTTSCVRHELGSAEVQAIDCCFAMIPLTFMVGPLVSDIDWAIASAGPRTTTANNASHASMGFIVHPPPCVSARLVMFP